jgi:hypothetical protein
MRPYYTLRDAWCEGMCEVVVDDDGQYHPEIKGWRLLIPTIYQTIKAWFRRNLRQHICRHDWIYEDDIPADAENGSEDISRLCKKCQLYESVTVYH